MASLRPVKRLVADRKRGEGKAEVPTKKRFKHILWMASRGDLGKRNIAIIWMLFGYIFGPNFHNFCNSVPDGSAKVPQIGPGSSDFSNIL